MNGWMWLSFGVVCCLVELATGSFYLLAVGLGLIEASTLAFLGMDLAWRIIVTGKQIGRAHV